MKKLVIIAAVALAGCAPVPVHQNFPNAPQSLLTPVPELKLVPPGSSASETFDVVVQNYGIYHQVSAQLQGWIDWYAGQRKIYDSVD